jgi:YVTN family beta-propeller protein
MTGAPSAGYTASQIPIPGPLSSTAIAVDSATHTVYAGAGNSVTVVNAASGSVTTTVSLTGPVQSIAVDAATNMVYVADGNVSGLPGVDVINGATNAVTATISGLAPGSVAGVAVDSTTNTVYVASLTGAAVTVIDGATNKVKTTIGTGTGTRPDGVAVDELTHVLWVADLNGSVIAIDGTTNSITGGLDLGGGEPLSVAVNAATDTVYATDFRNGEVAVIDGKTETVATLIPVGVDVDGIAVDQNSGVVYASTYVPAAGATWVIDGSSNHVADTIGRGGVSVAIDQATGTVYEAAWRYGAIWTLTASTANAWSPVITGTSVAPFTTGVAGKDVIASSALPVATFSGTGALPAGLTLNSAGVLAGTPAAGTGGLYPITITASNGVAPDYSQQINLTVAQPPVITSAASATFHVGSAGNVSFTASGYPAPAIYTSGALPAGVSLANQLPGGWQLFGTPAVGSGGVYPMTINAYNYAGTAVPQAFTLIVQEVPSFFGSTQATLLTGQAANVAVQAHGYPAPTFTESGKLPAGVNFSAGGVLTGSPAAGSGGSYPITITASNGMAPNATEAFTVNVNQTPAFTSPSTAAFRAGRRHTFTFRTTGFPAATLSEHGHLPAGITFKAGPGGTAVVSGRAPRADRGKTYVITISASNGIGAVVHQTFHLKIT